MKNYDTLINELIKNQDEKYAAFCDGLSGTEVKFIGVRMPILRKIAKEYQNLDMKTFKVNYTYELMFLFFYINLAQIKDIHQQINFIIANEKYFLGWSVVDSLGDMFTYPAKFSDLKEDLTKLFKEENQYCRRLAYHLMIHYSKDKSVLNEILDYIHNDDAYYVQMMESWLLSILYILYPDEIFMFIKNAKIDRIIINKAISKIHDSYRVSDENKNKIKMLRISK